MSRSGSPGVLLGRALALSLVLHALLFLPLPRTTQTPAEPALLSARLLPLLDAPPSLESSRTTEEVAEPAVLSAPTFKQGAAAPRLLTGKALQGALGKLSKEMIYPRAAIERGLEGTVTLLLLVAGDGTVQSVDIAASSGHDLLDDAALKAAGRIRQIPGGRRQVLLPVEFHLE